MSRFGGEFEAECGRRGCRSVVTVATTARKGEVKEVCLELIAEHGNLNTRQLADHLNGAGYKTVTGKAWGVSQVWRIMKAA